MAGTGKALAYPKTAQMLRQGKRVPDLLLIGAAKCGTTSLARIMAGHPEVFLPEEKEIRYFSREEYFRQGVDFFDKKYRAASDGQVLCDASPQYLFYHEKVVPRIIELYGEQAADLRFIVMLRNPADRAYSAYWQGLRFGVESRSFEEAIAAENEAAYKTQYTENGQTAGAYTIASTYASQLKPWFAQFKREQFLVLLFEGFKADSEAAVAQALAFAGCTSQADLSENMKVHNKASVPKNKAVNDLVYHDSALKRAFKALVPEKARKRIKDAINRQNQQEIDYQPMQAATRAALMQQFEPEIAELEQMLGRSLDVWRQKA